MHFVDHVDLVASIRGRVHRLLKQCRHFLNRTVTGSVHFDVINKATFIDCSTRFTDPARMISYTALTIWSQAI